MPPSTVFWVVAPPVVLLISTVIYFIRTRERS